MNKFTFWYKNEIKADNIAQAIKKEKKKKPELDEIKVGGSNDNLEPCIGFEVYDEDE